MYIYKFSYYVRPSAVLMTCNKEYFSSTLTLDNKQMLTLARLYYYTDDEGSLEYLRVQLTDNFAVNQSEMLSYRHDA